MIEIESVYGGELVAASWRSTYVLKPDQKLLVSSLVEFGWTSPLIVQAGTNAIIDGHERWMIAANYPEIQERDEGLVPVLFFDCDDVDAMIMHVKINRARGIMHAKSLSSVIRRILRSGAYNEDDLKAIFGFSQDEMLLLGGGGFLKGRKISEHKYSKAWVPVEAPPGASAPSVAIERPPNADR